MQFQRFKLAVPEAQNEEYGSEDGDSDGEDEVDVDKEDGNLAKKATATVKRRMTKRLTFDVTQKIVEENKAELYKYENLHEKINAVTGVSAKHYANVVEDMYYKTGTTAMTECENYAVIGFWNLEEDDTFKCDRFFVLPNPYKRMIKHRQDTELYQVLYTSQHSGEVFLFFQGYDWQDSGLYDDFRGSPTQMQCAIL